MPVIEMKQGSIYLRNVSPATISLHITTPSRMTSIRSALMGPAAIVDDAHCPAAGRDDAPLLFDMNEDGRDLIIRPVRPSPSMMATCSYGTTSPGSGS